MRKPRASGRVRARTPLFNIYVGGFEAFSDRSKFHASIVRARSKSFLSSRRFGVVEPARLLVLHVSLDCDGIATVEQAKRCRQEDAGSAQGTNS